MAAAALPNDISPPITEQTQKNTFRADRFVAENLGGELVSVDSTGSKAIIRQIDPNTGAPRERTFNMGKFLASQNRTVENTNVVWNTPETPLKEDSALSFSQQNDIQFARTSGDRRKFLQREFGTDNVKLSADKQFVVKGEDNIWRRAEVDIVCSKLSL